MTKLELIAYIGEQVNISTPNDFITASEVRNGILSVATYVEGNFVGKDLAGHVTIVGNLLVNGNINTSGSLLLSAGVFAYWDGFSQRITKRNSIPAISIGNSSTYYDNDLHVFRHSSGTELIRIDGANSIFQTSTTRNLFGAQTDDGTANQFAGHVKVKSNLYVTGTSVLGGLLMPANSFFCYTDSTNVSRRMLGLSLANNFYVGDVDNSISGSNNLYMSNNLHIWYTNGVQRMILAQNGSLGILNGNPAFPLDVNGNVNISGSLLLSGSGFAFWDGNWLRIQKRNGTSTFSIGN